MKINKEKFLESLNRLEIHQNNKINNNLEEAKKALEEIIREIEFLLSKSNSEFAEDLINSGINFQDIFDEIGEFNSREEVENKEEEFFLTFFTLYFTSLKESIESIKNKKNKEEVEGLIFILEIFQERKTFPLLTIYEGNEEAIKDMAQTLEAMKLSFGEFEEKEEVVIPSSSKSKGKEKEESLFTIEQSKQSFLIDAAWKNVNKDNIIELQKKIIKEKDEVIEEQKKEIERLQQELAVEKQKNQQLKLELEKLETKTEVLPKK